MPTRKAQRSARSVNVSIAVELAKDNGHENQRGGEDKHLSQLLGALTAPGVLLEIADVCPGPGGGDHRP
jgi:hypothetical protein